MKEEAQFCSIRGLVVADTYRIVHKIGEDGCGTIYRAEDIATKEDLRLKKLDKEDFDAGVKEVYRRLREARHPNVGRIHEFIEEEDCYWVVMELIHGEAAEHFICEVDHMEDCTPIPADDFWKIVDGVLKGLEYVHADPDIMVYHRNVTADNVMITFTEANQLESVQLIDFELCHDIPDNSMDGLGEDDVPVGTRGYKAPELYAGRFDQRSDLFAVGVIAWRLITGKWPYKLTDEKEEQMDNYAIRETITEQLQESLSFQCGWVLTSLAMYPGASSLLKLLLAPDPNDRAASASEALRHLADVRPCSTAPS
uniref:Protein kinase domain-containing protein n=1 Tax=Vitrella brassicaformis TaxID=1169539 RepID=A0A7S1KEE8_9ALVE|mmetsp:Transcript_50658/g.127039  ORF Transcript_50658/g.127039 Transcript_50658/m.127039 type:complete len:311 (+) Transcript_50658:166-1098(+)